MNNKQMLERMISDCKEQIKEAELLDNDTSWLKQELNNLEKSLEKEDTIEDKIWDAKADCRPIADIKHLESGR